MLLKETERHAPWLNLTNIDDMEGLEGLVVINTLRAYAKHQDIPLSEIGRFQMTPRQVVDKNESYWMFNIGQVFYKATLIGRTIAIKNADNNIFLTNHTIGV